MHSTRRILSILSALYAAAAAGLAPRAQVAASHPPKIALDVLFVGAAPDAPGKAADRAARTRDFVRFLGEEFESVRAAARDGFDPASVGDADVVLLDWAQSEVDLGKLGELRSPLGPRDAWAHPTVLLGSAGLLLAGPWQLKGAHG